MSDLRAKADKSAGKVKETTGKVTGNGRLEEEDKAEQAKGQAKEVLEDAKDKLGDAAEKMKRMLKKK
jgi:uncharacterized protein YjbJ (UPF0337 family)